MARKFLKKFIPHQDTFKDHPHLQQVFGELLHDPNLFHLNRHSVSQAMFIGLFTTFIPVPGQMVVAAFFAIIIRANLPISVLMVWVSNPVTMPALFYFAYKVGVLVTGSDAGPFVFELSWQWLTNGLTQIWVPFLVGCVVCGLFIGLLGSTVTRYLWRWYVIRRWRKRCARRLD